MSIFDTIKDMINGATDKTGQSSENAESGIGGVVEQGKQWVEGQGGIEGLKDKAAGIDIPGTDIDDQFKDKLGLGK